MLANSRRIVRISVSSAVFEQILMQGWTTRGRVITCTNGLPEGAKYSGCSFDPAKLDAYLFFVHDSFAEIVQGEIVPEMRVTWSSERIGELTNAH